MRQIRICMLVTSELDKDPRVKKEAQSAVNAGYEVIVICRSYNGEAETYKIKPIGTKRPSFLISKYFERLWTNLVMIWWSVRLNPDIIHANDLDTLPAGYVSSQFTGAKLIYDAHEFWADAGRDVGIGKKLVPIIEKLLVRRCDAVVAASKYRAKLMGEAYGISTPTTVMNAPLQIGVAPIKIDHSTSLSVPPEAVIKILHLGVYRANRGLENAVLSMKYLPPHIHLTFIGYGEIEETLRNLAAQERLENRIQFLPPVITEKVVEAASQYDVGLVLYRPVNLNNIYAAPNKLFEYMMAGLAIAGSNLPFIRDVIEDAQVGLTFDPDNPRDIANKISELASNPVRLQEMKRNALQKSSEYTWQTESAKLIDLYAKLMSN